MNRAERDRGNEGHILVVDDSPNYVRALTRMLTRQGYVVDAAGDGEAALEQVRSNPPDLILLDVNMPVMDGYQLCERLKASAETEGIPVIFISGADDVLNKVRAFACGGVDYIAKPFQIEEALARIKTHLALRSLQKHLEERVRDRTTELEEANAWLQLEIAERRQAEAALREREARIRRLVEANIIGVMFWNRDGTITEANDAFLRMLGYRRRDLAAGGVRWDGMLPAEGRETPAQTAAMRYDGACPPRDKELRRLDSQARCLASACPGCPPRENEFLRHDGSRVPVLVGSALLDGPQQGGVSFVLDLTERKGIEHELLESRERLRELAAHRDAVREQERKRIAGEIHDELGSLLTALKMDISLLRMRTGEDTQVQERLAQMRDLVDRTIQMVRHVATQLRPAALNLGIVPALEWLVQEFGQRTGIACRLDPGDEIRMNDAHATAIFRIVQESLTNAARHAQASRIDVSLRHRDGEIALSIVDDGCGFDPGSVRADAFGLLGIRERAQALGGTAEIASAPGAGCAVSIRIPFHSGAGL